MTEVAKTECKNFKCGNARAGEKYDDARDCFACWTALHIPATAAFLKRPLHAISGEPSPAVPKKAPCGFRSEFPLPVYQAARMSLDVRRQWHECGHPDKPNPDTALGKYVCPCKGCNSSCKGYVEAAPDELTDGAATPAHPPASKTVAVSFSHGIGDAVHFAHMIPLFLRRGYAVKVHPVHADQAPVFRAAGAEIVADKSLTVPHRWSEVPGRNKCLLNLSMPPMPNIGEAEPLWVEYGAERIDFAGQVTDEARQRVDDMLVNAQQPVLLLHVRGHAWANGNGEKRTYPAEQTAELQHLWVARTGGTVVMLDRDGTLAKAGQPLPGVIHVRDFGPAELFELISRADVFAGIDSGPLHFARFTDTPTVGIWLNHYPADFALLPRANTVHVVSARHAGRDMADGAKWRTRLADEEVPSAKFVADVVCGFVQDKLPPSNRIAQLTPDELPRMPQMDPWRMIERHPATVFPDAISTVARRIREAAESSPYDHRPFLHPGDTDFAAKLTEGFRAGYAHLKWAVAKVIQPRAICEIGVGGGLAALAFLDAAPSASYVGIDSCRYEDEFAVPLLGHVEEQFLALGRRGRILRQDSKTLRELPGEFDLVHVDGAHDYAMCRHDTELALRSGAPWVLVDDARDNQVCSAVFAALLAWRPGRTEWAMFEDTWTGSILIYTGENLR